MEQLEFVISARDATAAGVQSAIQQQQNLVTQAQKVARDTVFAAQQAARQQVQAAQQAVAQQVAAAQQLGASQAAAARAAGQQVLFATRQAVREQVQAVRQGAQEQLESVRQNAQAQVQAIRQAAQQQAQAQRQAQTQAAQHARDLQRAPGAFLGGAGLGSLAGIVNGLGSGSLSGLAGAFGSTISVVTDLAGRITGGLVGAFQSLTQAALQAAEAVGRTLLNAFSQVVGIAERVGLAIGGVVVAGFVALGKAGVEMNTSLMQARVGLTAITKDAGATERFIAQLRETARQTAPTFKELLPIGQQLAAVYGPTGLGKAIETIRAFDAAGKVLAGGDNDAIRRALVQFRQLAVAPGPRQQDLRLIEENLPGLGVQDILKQSFGTSDTRALSDAGITGRQVADALVKGMRDRFGAAGGQLADSWPILWSGLFDSLNDLSASVTERLTASLAPGIKAMSTAVQSLAGNQKFLDGLSVAFDLVGVAIEKAAALLPQFTNWLAEVVTRENVVNLIASVGAGVQTVGDEVTKFLSAAMGGRAFSDVWDAFGKSAEAGIDVAFRAWNGLLAGIRFLSENADSIFGLVLDALKPLGQWFEVALVKVQLLIQKLAEAGKNFGGGFGEGAGTGGGHTNLGFGQNSTAQAGFGGGEGAIVWRLLQQAGVQRFAGRIVGEATRAVVKPIADALNAGPAFPDIGKAWQGSNIQGRAQALWQSGQQAVQDAMAQGLPEARARFEAHRRQNAAGINQALGPGQVPGTGLPPAHLMSQVGVAGAAGAASGFLDDKKAKELLQHLNAVYDARLAGYRALVEEQPQERQAIAALQILGPELQRQQENLAAHMRRLNPQSEAFLKAQTELFKLRKQGLDLQQAAQKEQERADKEAQSSIRQAFEGARKFADEQKRVGQLSTQVAEQNLKANPFLNDQQRKRGLLPSLLAQFRERAEPYFNESKEDELERRLDLGKIRERIFESLGIQGGGKDFVRTLGGGLIPKFNPREVMGAQRELDRIQRDAEAHVRSFGPMVPLGRRDDGGFDYGSLGDPSRTARREGANVSVNVNTISPERLWNDPQFARELADFIEAYGDREARRVWPGQ